MGHNLGWFDFPINDMDGAINSYNSILKITLPQMVARDLQMPSLPFVEGGYSAGDSLNKPFKKMPYWTYLPTGSFESTSFEYEAEKQK